MMKFLLLNLFLIPLISNWWLLTSFLGSMWFMPNFSTYMIYSSSFILSDGYSDLMDMGWGEYLMSNSLIIYFNFMSKIILFYQNNSIKIFFCSFILISIIILLI